MKKFKAKLEVLYRDISAQVEMLEHEAEEKNLLNDIVFMKHYYMFWGKKRMLEILLNEINIYLMKKAR